MEKNEIEIITKENLENKIYFIRGQKVMLDRDLAEIYGYETKRFNEQVKNNIEKFEEDFMFQLTKEEQDSLMCQFDISKTNFSKETLKSKFSTSNNFNCGDESLKSNFLTSKNFNYGKEILMSQNLTTKNKSVSLYSDDKSIKPGRGGVRKLPYAFTEQGIYMLMTVLRGELAVKQSKALIRLFKSMKDTIVENSDFLVSRELFQIETRTSVLETDMKEVKNDLKKVMDNFIDEDSYKHFLIMDGKKLEADAAYRDIYKTAKKSIYVIDNYISLKTLELLSNAKENVKIILFSDNIAGKDSVKEYMLLDFQSQNPTNPISLHKTNNRFHDRYIIIDYNTDNESIYHCGPSSKDAGNRIGTIIELKEKELYHSMIDDLLN